MMMAGTPTATGTPIAILSDVERPPPSPVSVGVGAGVVVRDEVLLDVELALVKTAVDVADVGVVEGDADDVVAGLELGFGEVVVVVVVEVVIVVEGMMAAVPRTAADQEA
jgi:hypothetical protein